MVTLSTGLVTALAIRSAFVFPEHSYSWVLLLFASGPNWLLLAGQVFFYGFLLAVCVVFFQAALGKERFVVVAWILAIFLDPLETFLPTVANLLEVVTAMGMVAALLVTVDILLRQFSSQSSEISISPC
jgi:hypothetical protein